jgi:hypothetical protein
MKIHIKSKFFIKLGWRSVAYWKWNVNIDSVCGICRVEFESTCPTCFIPGDDCPLSIDY